MTPATQSKTFKVRLASTGEIRRGLESMALDIGGWPMPNVSNHPSRTGVHNRSSRLKRRPGLSPPVIQLAMWRIT